MFAPQTIGGSTVSRRAGELRGLPLAALTRDSASGSRPRSASTRHTSRPAQAQRWRKNHHRIGHGRDRPGRCRRQYHVLSPTAVDRCLQTPSDSRDVRAYRFDHLSAKDERCRTASSNASPSDVSLYPEPLIHSTISASRNSSRRFCITVGDASWQAVLSSRLVMGPSRSSHTIRKVHRRPIKSSRAMIGRPVRDPLTFAALGIILFGGATHCKL
jgi:hypothetical protein